jgi:bifunctional DNA-binding transcriptional regulator/antitoxin component of YhaV-PrlF toxin-antitoxin module
MPNESRVSKGYLTVVPKAIRAAAGVAAGDRLTWTIEGERIVVIPRHVRSLSDIKGLTSHGGDAVRAKRRVQRRQL